MIASAGTFDTARFRTALGRFASGVTVNAVVSVSLDLPLVLV